jgi:hypothetical protein
LRLSYSPGGSAGLSSLASDHPLWALLQRQWYHSLLHKPELSRGRWPRGQRSQTWYFDIATGHGMFGIAGKDRGGRLARCACGCLQER